MKIEHSFEVEASIDTVWQALTDIPRVAPCLPGADINEKQDDGSYKGTFTVKLGPTTASYRGQLRMDELDESSHTVTMRGDGTDKRGQGGVKATVVSKMREENGVTHVDIDTDLNITGRLARFGRGGMVQDVSTKLLDRFAECLKDELTSGGGGNGAAAEAPAAEAGEAAGAEATEAAATPAPTEAPEGAQTAEAAADETPAAGGNGTPSPSSPPAAAAEE
ncbi:MAG TPA: SRPBCC family protein, partial [Solirubrobacteraceae bacterium]